MALKTINGVVRGPDGLVKAGVTVIAKLSQAVTLNSTDEVVASVVRATTDINGAYSLTLHANNDLAPMGTFYTINEADTAGTFNNVFTIVVPQTAGPFVIPAIMIGVAPTASPQAGRFSTLTVDGAATLGPGSRVASDFFASNPPNGPYGSKSNIVVGVSSVNLQSEGADMSGGTNSDAAWTKAFNDLPTGGGKVHVPPGIVQFTTIAPPTGCWIEGEGWWTNTRAVFGTASWLVGANRGGSVLVSTSTSGPSLLVASQDARARLSGFILVGPGTGTPTGIQLGTYPTYPIVEARIDDILTVNFATGWDVRQVEESTFVGARAIGCSTGFTFPLNDATNNNVWLNTEIQYSTVYALSILAGNSGNSFLGGLVQNCSGTAGLDIHGNHNRFEQWWLEVNTATKWIQVPVGSGDGTHLVDMRISANGTIQIDANSVLCENFYWIGGGGVFNNTGIENIFFNATEGSTFTDSGTQTTLIGRSGTARWPGGLQLGTIAGANQTGGTLYMGTGAPSGGTAGSWFLRTDGGGAGTTHLYFNNGGSWLAVA